MHFRGPPFDKLLNRAVLDVGYSTLDKLGNRNIHLVYYSARKPTIVIYLGFGSLLRKDCYSSLNKLCVTQV